MTVKERLEQLTQTLEISDSVIFSGALDHSSVLETMKGASIYAMSSISEGFGFVLIEAMSCGFPAVCFDVRVGPRAIINDGINGYLVEDNNEDAYINALYSLMDDDEKRLTFSQSALNRAADFTEDKLITKWLSIFEQTI